MAAHYVLGLTLERTSHVRKCPRCNEAPPQSLLFGSVLTVSGTSMSGELSTFAMLMDHIPRCPYSWYVTQLLDRVVHVFEELILEAGLLRGFSRSTWGCGVFILHGSTPSSCY
jgi:hypothetical protein